MKSKKFRDYNIFQKGMSIISYIVVTLFLIWLTKLLVIGILK